MSVLSEVASTDIATNNNIELNITLNEYANIMESNKMNIERIKLEPDMVPIVKMYNEGEGCDTYCVDGQCFKRMLDDNSLTVSDGIDALFAQIQKDPNCEIETTCEMAILLNEDNTSDIYDKIMENTEKIIPATKAVQDRINYINNIKETGCRVFFC